MQYRYDPGRFSHLYNLPEGKKIWQFLTSEKQLDLMTAAVQENSTPITPLLHSLEGEFADLFSSEEYPADDVATFVNNMIKQILIQRGFEHVGCGFCNGRFVKNSGVFGKAEKQ